MANMITENVSKGNGPTPDFKTKVQNAEHQLEKMSRDTGEKIGSMASDLMKSTSEYVKTGQDYVKENPAKSIAIAAAAGAVAGSLITIVMRRKH